MDLYFKVLKLFPLILNLSSITMALNLRFIMEDSYIQLLIFLALLFIIRIIIDNKKINKVIKVLGFNEMFQFNFKWFKK